jgi:signal transduction histidine kinase
MSDRATRLSGAMPLPRGAVLDARNRRSHVLARVIWWLVILLVLVEVLFLGGLVVSDENNPVVNVGLALATQWIPVTILWLVVARTRFARAEVVLAASAVTLSAVGDSYYSLAMDSEGYLAFPSPADVGYLLFYPLMFAALVVLVRRQRAVSANRLMVLEGTVATLGAAAVLLIVLDPVLSDALTGDNPLASTIAIAYPLFDLVLLAAITGIAASPNLDAGRRWWSLVVGLVITIAADIAYALLEHYGNYIAGTPLDASWAIGLAFITWWAVGLERGAGGAGTEPRKSSAVPMPAIAVLAGLGVLIYGTQVAISPFALVLATATVGLAAVPIIFRQSVVGRVLDAQADVVRELTAIDRAKTDMMITMNHEFRTPLTSINGYVELLLDGDGGELPTPAVKMLRVVESNTARLQDLVDDLLTMSKLESEKAVVDPAPVYLAGVLRRAAESIAPLSSSRGVEVTVECHFAPIIDGDVKQLERAFTDLVENAVKFTLSGGTVRVVAQPARSEDGHSVTVRVVDTGIGVPEDELPHLFTKFFRASNARAAAIPGVGLGLAIARATFEAHGGRIAADSKVGGGTTMRVELPLSPRTFSEAREAKP